MADCERLGMQSVAIVHFQLSQETGAFHLSSYHQESFVVRIHMDFAKVPQ